MLAPRKQGAVTIDGLFMRIETHVTTESLNTSEYYSDQKGFGFSVQSSARSNYAFVNLTVKNHCSTNNFSAFTRSGAWRLTQKLPPRYFVIGYATYLLAKCLLTSYPGKQDCM